MSRQFIRLGIIAALACLFPLGAADGQQLCRDPYAQPYLTLRTPPAPAPHRPDRGYYPGIEQPVRSSGYSYGWFGVGPRSHWSRHFGYYRQYTEWSAR